MRVMEDVREKPESSPFSPQSDRKFLCRPELIFLLTRHGVMAWFLKPVSVSHYKTEIIILA